MAPPLSALRKNTLPALFIGRFQPPHLGHEDALKQILGQEEKVIIVIGSSQKSRTKDNPFTGGEREEMLGAVLKDLKVEDRCVTVKVPDIHDDERWVGHVEKTVPEFGNVYTGSLHTKKLFLRDRKHPVIDLEKRINVSATQVRAMLGMRETAGIQALPKPVAELLRKKLLQKIVKNHSKENHER